MGKSDAEYAEEYYESDLYEPEWWKTEVPGVKFTRQPEQVYDPEAIFPNYKSMLDYTYSLTPCRLNPEDCQPRRIKHVVLDADDTIWNISPYSLGATRERRAHGC